jgi:apolipoprotein N-acyltransferase
MGAGIYHKQRLVPFGDYVPLREWFGPVLSVFNLPMSVLEPGPGNQRGLQVAEALIAPSICYEIAYPDTVARGAAEANVLITISNDAWFGASIGPLQHMQIAQMRALETGRYLIRATNNGVSALVDSKGEIISKTDQFVQATLEGKVELRQGLTPFMRWGSEPVVFLTLVLAAAAFGFVRRQSR